MTTLFRYEQETNADLLMVQAWVRMRDDGDLDRVFSTPNHPPSAFLRMLAPPHEALYAVDERGVWFLTWFEQFMSGTFFAAWVRPDKRGSLDGATTFLRVLRSGVKAYGTVLTLTWQESLMPVHYALGFDYVGRITRLFGGRDALVFAISASSVERRRTQWKALKARAILPTQPALPNLALDAVAQHRAIRSQQARAVWDEAYRQDAVARETDFAVR